LLLARRAETARWGGRTMGSYAEKRQRKWTGKRIWLVVKGDKAEELTLT
jgi:hypothetical protein